MTAARQIAADAPAMPAAPAAGTAIAADDPRLRYRGAVSLQRGAGWVAPWRVPHAEARLHLPTGGIGRAAMTAGVRVCLCTDARSLRCTYQADPGPALNGPQEAPQLDVVFDGEPVTTVALETAGSDARFAVTGLPGRIGTLELWLPVYHQFRLVGLELSPSSTVLPDERDRPRWVHYGSSISQGRGARSPSATWAAQAARGLDLDLTLLALGAACHMQPMSARLMRDQPAELLSACIGINSQALGALNAETFLAAAIGFVQTVRERHPDTPFVLISTIHAPERERTTGPSGLTVRQCRSLTERAVELLRAHGDRHTHYLDGRELFGPDCADLFLEPDGVEKLHPNPDGHARMAAAFVRGLRAIDAEALACAA